MNSNFQYEAHGMRYRKLTTEFKKSVLQHIKQSYVALSTCKTLQEEKKKEPPPEPSKSHARHSLANIMQPADWASNSAPNVVC